MPDFLATTDDQDIFDLDIDSFSEKTMAPIDAIRSKTSAEGYIESRTNAFYRMIGFPIINSASEWFSSGYDVNLNMDSEALKTANKVIDGLKSNNNLLMQLEARESTYKIFKNVFETGGFNSKAISLGSVFIREFDKQFGDTEPLERDDSQSQTVTTRSEGLTSFYMKSDEQLAAVLDALPYLKSSHFLKPFIVDPRIAIYPDTNLIAAPFLVDASQLKCFGNTLYKRPYIERVISIRLNNQNNIGGRVELTKIIDNIKKDNSIIDKQLLEITSSPATQIQNSDAYIFKKYFNIIKALITNLVEDIFQVLQATQIINFQPLPKTKNGLEGPVELDQVSYDPNNKELEDKILNLYYLNYFNDLSNISTSPTLDLKTNDGGFVFSNLGDIVFSTSETSPTSLKAQLDKAVLKRKNFGDLAIDRLKDIEKIMGEFSGLGLIDIVAIQSAFWLMDQKDLIGLIDEPAFLRLKAFRENLTPGDERSDIITALKAFETKLKEVYSLIQLLFNDTYSGKGSSAK